MEIAWLVIHVMIKLETRVSLRRTEEIYMSKKYYPIEDAVNNVSEKFKLGLKDANEMDEEEFSPNRLYKTELNIMKITVLIDIGTVI